MSIPEMALRLVSLRIRCRNAEKRVSEMEHDNLDGAEWTESEIRREKDLLSHLIGESAATMRLMVRTNGPADYKAASDLANDVLEGMPY